ncbi:MAG: hypothetical protein JWO50_587 [Candidatus Kaiserbacteria bacterium]|nr:hypothetical protein [Candidatus Kaiserbacteria bacterium]
MFGRKKAKPQTGSATDLYVLNMIAQVLKDNLNTEIFLTQYRLDYESIISRDNSAAFNIALPPAEELWAVKAVRKVQAEVLFASPSVRTPFGRENQLPNLPRAVVLMTLVSQTSGFYLWEVESMEVYVEYWPGRQAFHFVRSFLRHIASSKEDSRPNLKGISNFLRDNGPREVTYRI